MVLTSRRVCPQAPARPTGQDTRNGSLASPYVFNTAVVIMIRFRRLPQHLLDAWLPELAVPAGDARYRLRVWRENRACLASIAPELVWYIEEALDDARNRLRRGLEDSLSPFREVDDPARNYPGGLHQITLQGYLGEILGAIAIEHWGAHGHTDWAIPAFLFRFHVQEFQHLDSINERLATGQSFDRDAETEVRPGRTGDDGLAFRLNTADAITDVVVFEAKCVTAHRAGSVTEAHQKLSAGSSRPSGIRELIEILEDYDTPLAHKWQKALVVAYATMGRSVRRRDAVSYACGGIPVRRASWMPTTPHPAYTASRELEGLEFQLGELAALIDTVYRGR